MAKFKKGDKVKIVSCKYSWNALSKYIGTTGVVQQDDSSVPYVQMDIDGTTSAFGEYDLELVKEEETKVKLPIGTRVKIIGQQYEHMKSIGKIGVITDNTGSRGRCYCVKYPGDFWYYKREELEVLPKFSKSDLKNGMLVQTRDGDWQMVMFGVENFGNTEDVLVDIKDGYIRLSNYDEYLKNNHSELYDVIKVATVMSPVKIFDAIREGNSVESCSGFKVIYDAEQEKAKQEAEQQIAKLKEQLEAEQEKLRKLSA